VSQAAESSPIKQAAKDARYLLGRGYPREQVLVWVGDRYSLSAPDRHVIRRGVFARSEAKQRRGRLGSFSSLAGRLVGVDGHNVLITLETALSGGRLLLADDGVVRDIAALGRHHRPTARTWRAAELMLSALRRAEAKGALILLEAKLPKSGELAKELRRLLGAEKLTGDALALPVPEKGLLTHQGPVATSDSALLDAVAMPLDLAGAIIRRRRMAALERL